MRIKPLSICIELSGFDLALLIPYFIVMLILAFYGIHRYQLVWLYYRNKKQGGDLAGFGGAVSRKASCHL